MTLLNFFIRGLLLNGLLINSLNLIFMLVLSESNYLTYCDIIYFITYAFEMALIFTLLFNKDNRGIHDIISNTKVIEQEK